MENEEINLNTESNDIAGNRIDGPVGNTAARASAPGTGTGIPGGPPAQAPSNSPDISSPSAPASSESLVDSEMNAGQGSVDADADERENKEANPDDLRPKDTYGGNFGNSTQGSYRDEDRRENQEEIFVHQTGLIHEIQEGDRVEFNVKAGKKGPNAVEVTRIQ